MPVVRENRGVSDPQNLPRPSESDGVEPFLGERPDQVETDVTSDTVTVRRAPRYGRFILLGVILGAVVALILTFTFTGQPVEGELVQFDKGQVFGFLLLVCGVIGAAIGAVVALLIDRSSARRAQSVTVEHESTHRAES
jgi:hypothetical protein